MAKPKRIVRLTPGQFEAAAEAAIAMFPSKNPQGVFGIAIHQKMARGYLLPFSTLTVFVPCKLDRPPHPIHSVTFIHEGRSYEIQPDVVATGRRGAAVAGEVVTFTGLHAGSAIRVDAGRRCAGGVACILGSGGEPTHLLTAGHLFPGNRRFPVLAAPDPSAAPVIVGHLALNLLHPIGGLPSMDAALVELSAAGRRMAHTSRNRRRHPRLRAAPFDHTDIGSTRLKVFLPMTGDYQTGLRGSLTPNLFRLSTDCRPPYEVRNVLLTVDASNEEGNSGTILMTDERRDFSDPVLGSAVGVVIGKVRDLSVHEPVDRALAIIRRNTGLRVAIWS